MPELDSIPMYTRVDIKKYAAIARWLRLNAPKLQPTRSKARVITVALNFLHTLLEKYEKDFTPISDVEEALILLDQWGIGLTNEKAKEAAISALEFEDDPDLAGLASGYDEEEIEEAVEQRIRELLGGEE